MGGRAVARLLVGGRDVAAERQLRRVPLVARAHHGGRHERHKREQRADCRHQRGRHPGALHGVVLLRPGHVVGRRFGVRH